MSKPLLVVALTAAVLLAACSSSGSGGVGESGAQSPPPASSTGDAPTAEQTAWAGNVCTAAADLQTSIEGLSTAATAGGGDVKAALQAQLDTINASAQTLVDTLAAPPAVNADDPDVAAVKAAADQLKSSISDIESGVQAAGSADGAAATVAALAAVSAAAAVSLTALGATTKAIETAAADGKGSLNQAFAANTSCTSLAP